MKKIYYFLLILSFTTNFKFTTMGQNYKWTDTFGDDRMDDCKSITTDALGNIYATGYFTGTVNFDPNGTDNHSSKSAIKTDVFIKKMDASGNLIWAKTFGSNNDDEGKAIVTDAVGNVYVAGNFAGNVDFDPGAGTAMLDYIGGYDGFLIKLDNSGNYVWALTLGAVTESVAIDPSGNIYLAGKFSGTEDLNPGSAQNNYTSKGSDDVYIEKINSTGNLVWVKTFGGSGQESPLGITVDKSGNIYTAGYFSGKANFNPLSIKMEESNGSYDVFVQKISSNGMVQWVRTFGDSLSDGAETITTDAIGNVYIAGEFNGTVDFDPSSATDTKTSVGGYDVFIAKLDVSGNYKWSKTFGGSADDQGRSISTDAANNVLTTGCFYNTVDFDPGKAIDNYTSNGYLDVFIQKLDSTGKYIQNKTFGGTYDDQGRKIIIDNANNLYLCGLFSSSGMVDFNPNAGTDYYNSNGLADGYILKMKNSKSTSIDYIGKKFESDSTESKFPSEINKLNDNLLNTEIKVYPNPSSGDLKISLDKDYAKVEIEIMNYSGQLISKKVFYDTNYLDLYLDGPTGIYFLFIKNELEQSMIRKIIKN